MTRMICVFLVVSFSVLACLQAGEMSELEKRKAFAKAYTESPKPEQRVAALQLLSGCKEEPSFIWLMQVAKTDVEPAVRLSAYNLVSEWDDPMGRMERILLSIYLNEKNRETQIAMCQAFPKLKTKTAAIEATIKLLGTCTHPSNTNWDHNRHRDYNRNNNGGGGNGAVYSRRRSQKSIDAARKQFTEVLGVLNTLTGQSFPANNRTRIAVKKWWIMHQVDFMKADAATQKKLAAEARLAANNRNKKRLESDIE